MTTFGRRLRGAKRDSTSRILGTVPMKMTLSSGQSTVLPEGMIKESLRIEPTTRAFFGIEISFKGLPVKGSPSSNLYSKS